VGSADGSVAATAALVHDTLVVATVAGHVMAFDGKTGATRWRANVKAPVRVGVTAIDRRAVVVDQRGTVHLLALDSGRQVTQWMGRARQVGEPGITDGHYYITLSNGHVYALPY